MPICYDTVCRYMMRDKNFEEYELKNSVEEVYYHSPSKMAETAFFYLLSAGRTKCARNYQVMRHDNKSLLLMYVERGTLCGKCQNKEFFVSDGEVLFLNCMNNHEYRVKGDSAEILWFHFYGATGIEYYNILQQKFGNVIRVSKTEEIKNLFEEILNINRKEIDNFELVTSLKILNLMTMLYAYGVERRSSLQIKNRLVETVVNYIKENFDKKVRIRDIAAKTNYNEYYLSHVFKEIIGESIYEYLTRFRIDVAKRLLISGDYTVEEIGEKVGYNFLADFIRNFKKIEHMTPLQYRLNNKNFGEGK